MANEEQIKILIEDVLSAANQILGDFDCYSHALQVDELGCYGPQSGIELLRIAVSALEDALALPAEKQKISTYDENYKTWVLTGHWPGQMTKVEQAKFDKTHCKYCHGLLEHGNQTGNDGFCSDHCRYNSTVL